jgi:ATP-dependent Clp protease ATP-binding subunit ClpA
MSGAYDPQDPRANSMPYLQATHRLGNTRLVSLDVAGLLAGTQYRGTFEERVHGVLQEVQQAQGKVMLFIDEVHTLVGAGAVRTPLYRNCSASGACPVLLALLQL